MFPEEKMAQRILLRHGLEPPFNLEDLVANYAHIEIKDIPLSVDGISIGIDGLVKPQIIINSGNPQTRQRFTLAHELGHIFIPWHTGTIISHIDNQDSTEVQTEYRKMETEANRFAAELLLPSQWIKKRYKEINNIEKFLKTILEDSGTSSEAAFIKTFNSLDERIVLAEINKDGLCIRRYKTRNAPKYETLNNNDLLNYQPFTSFTSCNDFYIHDKHYLSWYFDEFTIEETDDRTWRDLIKLILVECQLTHCLSSVNAVLPNVFQKYKHKSIVEIYSQVMFAYEGREKYMLIIKHPLFSQYVIKRVKELHNKMVNGK